jgi:hypothetical protein
MAMFSVNREEKARRIRCSREVRQVSLKTPFVYRARHPTEEQAACSVVSNQGKANCG